MPNTDPRDRELAALYEVNAALREQLNATQRDRRCMIREIGRLRAIEAEAKAAQPQPPAVSKAELRERVEKLRGRASSYGTAGIFDNGFNTAVYAVLGAIDSLPDSPEAKPWRAYVVQIHHGIYQPTSAPFIPEYVAPTLRQLSIVARQSVMLGTNVRVYRYGETGRAVEEVPAGCYSRDGKWLPAEEVADE